jgi:polyhydroxyalkanoate synthesis repressor PhaR
MSTERVIRKYANRRLYDATDSRHVTLEDIRRMIGAGERVKVVDDQTGEDVTRSILLQIIANQEQFGTPVLSTQLLEAIIRFYGNPVQEMLTRYLEQSIGSLLRQQEVMRNEMTKVLQSPLAPVADMARQNMELWARMQASMLSAFAPTGSAPTGNTSAGGAEQTRSTPETPSGTPEQPPGSTPDRPAGATQEQAPGASGRARKKGRPRKRRG